MSGCQQKAYGPAGGTPPGRRPAVMSRPPLSDARLPDSSHRTTHQYPQDQSQRRAGRSVISWATSCSLTFMRWEAFTSMANVFGFDLTDEQMTRIAYLDTGTSLFFDHRDPAMTAQLGASTDIDQPQHARFHLRNALTCRRASCHADDRVTERRPAEAEPGNGAPRPM